MQQNQLKGSLMLFFCALIWGLAFVAQRLNINRMIGFLREERAYSICFS